MLWFLLCEFLKVIENLEKLKRLHTLNLAHNSIERLERLDTLLKLKDLDVSHNQLYKIEGIVVLYFDYGWQSGLSEAIMYGILLGINWQTILKSRNICRFRGRDDISYSTVLENFHPVRPLFISFHFKPSDCYKLVSIAIWRVTQFKENRNNNFLEGTRKPFKGALSYWTEWHFYRALFVYL